MIEDKVLKIDRVVASTLKRHLKELCTNRLCVVVIHLIRKYVVQYCDCCFRGDPQNIFSIWI